MLDKVVAILGSPDLLSQIRAENIYHHVVKLEGTRHPITSLDKLNKAADYISSQFTDYGLNVKEQEVQVPGFEGTFRNIEASIRNNNGPETLIASHYDTVEDCPGANDNASAVATMLETARVLSKEKNIGNITFISFTLEEGDPALQSKIHALEQNLGLIDQNNHYVDLQTRTTLMTFWRILRENWRTLTLSEATAKAKDAIGDKMTETIAKYTHEIETIYQGMTATTWVERICLLGSSQWLKQANQEDRKVNGMICLDTIGYATDQQHTQTFPPGISPRALKTLATLKRIRTPQILINPFMPAGFKPDMFLAYKASDPNVGNFICALADINSGQLLKSFHAQCKLDSVDLPNISLQIPSGYEQIATNLPDLIRSDHAPFWRQGIPALFITDTANLRYPYYHTQADTTDKLDFNFITKICKATTATALHVTGNTQQN